MTIFERLIAAGIKVEHHASDLYVPITPESLRVLQEYGKGIHMSTFRSHDGMRWFDIPFAYDPFWSK